MLYRIYRKDKRVGGGSRDLFYNNAGKGFLIRKRKKVAQVCYQTAIPGGGREGTGIRFSRASRKGNLSLGEDGVFFIPFRKFWGKKGTRSDSEGNRLPAMRGGGRNSACNRKGGGTQRPSELQTRPRPRVCTWEDHKKEKGGSPVV